jgi:hypothetical protein
MTFYLKPNNIRNRCGIDLFNYYKDLYAYRICDDVIILEEYPSRNLYVESDGKIRDKRNRAKRRIIWYIKYIIGILNMIERGHNYIKLPQFRHLLNRSFIAYDQKTGEVAIGSIYMFLGYNIMIVLGAENSELVKKLVEIYDPHAVISKKKFNIECKMLYERKGFIVCKRKASYSEMRYAMKKEVLEKLKREIEL